MAGVADELDPIDNLYDANQRLIEEVKRLKHVLDMAVAAERDEAAEIIAERQVDIERLRQTNADLAANNVHLTREVQRLEKLVRAQ